MSIIFPKDKKKSGEEFLAIMFDLLAKDKSKKMKGNHLFAIGVANEYLNDEQFEILLSYKNSRSKFIKRGLAHALLELKNNEAIEIIIKLTNERYRNTRYWAVWGLTRLEEEYDSAEIIAALWKRVKDNDYSIRKLALLSLAKRKDERIKEILQKEYLKTPDTSLLGAMEEFEDIKLLNFIKENVRLIKLHYNANQNWHNEYCEYLDKIILELESKK